MVVRLAENGCLLAHLKKNRQNPYVNDSCQDSSQMDKIRIARDIANGMLHLATKKVREANSNLESDWLPADPF